MSQIRCLAIDDEPLALDLIVSYIQRTPFLELVQKCSAPETALSYLNQGIDLIFIDIQMPSLLGTDFIRSLSQSPMVIFSTAFDQYAIEGFRLDAVDYLLKPYGYGDFLRAAQKAKQLYELKNSHNNNSNDSKSNEDFFFVRSEHRLIRIDISKILYIEGMKDYVKIHLEEQEKPVLTLMSLKSLEEQLKGNSFMRVHRSFIVNLSKVESIERSEARIGKAMIPIADRMRDLLPGAI